MIDKHIQLKAQRVWYYSKNDEAAFFEWLDKIPCVKEYEGELDVLNIDVDKVNESDLRELLSLFRRYGIDMKQLAVFDAEEFSPWFRDPKAYWFKQIF